MSRKMSFTSLDLAQTLGVSQATVSRAFDPKASIAPAMRQRVLAAADAAGYVPNRVASSLSRSGSRMIGIVAGDLTNPFYPEIIAGLSQRFQRDDRQCLLFTLEHGERAEDRLRLLRLYNVDAAIIVSATIRQTTAAEWTRDRTMVLFNRTIPGLAVSSISCDNAAGAALLAEHLVRTGRRRIAFAAGPQDTSTTRDRQDGFLAALARLGVALLTRYDGDAYTFESGMRAAQTLAPHRPDAIFFANDIMAIGGIEGLRACGLTVPGDVAVAGFDDIPMASWPSYDLTTIRQPVGAMIESAFDLIGNSAAPPELRCLPGALIVRGSTGPG